MISWPCPAAQHCAMAHFTALTHRLLSLGGLQCCWTALGTSLDTTDTNLNCKSADSHRVINLCQERQPLFQHTINLNFWREIQPHKHEHWYKPLSFLYKHGSTLYASLLSCDKHSLYTGISFLNNNSKCCPYWAIFDHSNIQTLGVFWLYHTAK